MFIALGVSLLLTFSFIFVQKGVEIITRIDLKKYTIYFWGIIVIVVSIFSKHNYIYNIPDSLWSVMALFLIVALVNLLIARSSGYNPMGRHDTIHFVISYPLIEEAVFRGLMLPILSNSTTSVLPLTIVGLPVKYTVLITAFLFAICHLQYYKLSRMSIRFMMFAFSGGIFFGIIADQTKSILLPIILHIEFNALSVYFSRRKIS